MSTPRRLQVVVAHPDDETFGCGSVLLHAAGSGAVTAVCCATRGELGESTDGLPADALGAVREAELRRAAELLGVGRIDLLHFGDSGMSGDAPAGSLAAADPADVTAAVAASMAQFRPDVVVTLDASDGHRDHVRIRDAAITAADRCGVPRVFLSCLPRSLMRRWAGEMSALRPEMEHLNADVAGLGTPDDELTTVIDATGHLPARERAMAAHASQASPYDGLSADLRGDFLSQVYLRRLIPPWPGGPAREGPADLFGDADGRIG